MNLIKAIGKECRIMTLIVVLIVLNFNPSIFYSVVGEQLEETAQLIDDLQKVQNERLSQPSLPYPPYAPQPNEVEMGLASRITDNLTDMAKQLTPGDLVSPETIRKVMGIDIESATYKPPVTTSST